MRKAIQLHWLIVVGAFVVHIDGARGHLNNGAKRTLEPLPEARDEGQQLSAGSSDPAQHRHVLQADIFRQPLAPSARQAAGGGRGTEENSIETNEVRFRFELADGLHGDRLAKHGNSVASSSSSCPYIIPTQEEADARSSDPYYYGNVLVVDSFNYGRTGNRFLTLNKNLSVGYCCKSKLVSLPPKDEVLAPGIFGEGSPGPRNFDFSRAPDVDGFDHRSCPPSITWGGTKAFHLTGVHDEEHPNYIQGLSGCLHKVPSMIACEAAYMFPTDIDLCPAGETRQGRSFAGGERGEQWGEERVEPRDNEEVAVEGQDDGSSGGDAVTSLRGARGVTGAGNAALGTDHEKEDGRDDLVVKGDQQARATDGTDDDDEEEGAGNLVVHVRSGDIFVDPVHPGYGQPPLEFYTRAIEERKWARVDIVTNGIEDDQHALNPVVPALEAKVAAGDLPANIHFYKNRSMAEDLLSMVCADGFVAAQSTLKSLVLHHSRATRMYFPEKCNGSLRQHRSRPEMEVFGMSSKQEDYTVYQRWNNTPSQVDEMLTFNVTGVEQCIMSDSHAR